MVVYEDIDSKDVLELSYSEVSWNQTLNVSPIVPLTRSLSV